jgi:nucleotide-binding universal stress UspA family protein
MSSTFIVGYDGSAASRAALHFAEQLAPAEDAKVLAAHVYVEVPHAYGKGVATESERMLRDDAHADAERTLEEVADRDVGRCAVASRSSARGLHAVAEQEGASLLAVGTTHRGPLGRLVPGGVPDRLLHGAPCRVAVVPGDRRDGPIETIAVGYDASPESVAAVHTAARLAGRLRARLVLLAVHEPLLIPYEGGAVPPPAADLDAELLSRLEGDIRVAARELDAEWRVERGAAWRTLVDSCSSGVDLLVIGSRGYGPVRTVLLGSVARHVVDHAPCAVLVVPRPDDHHRDARDSAAGATGAV